MLFSAYEIRRRPLTAEYIAYMKLNFYERKAYRIHHGKPKKYKEEE